MPRDYRIDFFRGLALISIFVNHIPGNWFSNFTHRNFGLSDAAEVFVLLAGISAALAYYPRFINGQAGLSIAQIVKRIGTIYIAHLSSIAIGFAVYAGASLWLNRPELLIPDERHWIVDQTVQSLAGIGALTYQTGNFNILPMYIGMLAMLPFIMMLARISLLLALASSALLWLVANVFHFGPPNFPGTGIWYFNPLTWQLIFTIGFCGGVHLRRGTRVAPSPVLYGASLAYLIAAALLVMLPLWDRFPVMPEWIWISGFNKSWVGLFRLFHLLALVYVVLCSPIPAFLRARLTHDNWIVSLGRNTLPVFWLSTLLAVIGHIIREDVFMLPNDPILTAKSFAVDCVIVVVGGAMLFALAQLLDWTKPGAKPRTQPAEGRSPLAVRRLEPAE
nr:OpgC domain-containing protein [Mesorhizobium sp. BR1-1-16]